MTDVLEPAPTLGHGADGDWHDLEEAPGFWERYWPPSPNQWLWIEAVATAIVVFATVWCVVGQLHPSLILADTTPAGGDMGAHVWGPAYLRDHILPHWRLSGWSPDWYAGFPMYQFYMVIPALMVVALNLVLPYGIALKIVSVLGMASLPVATWFFGKMAGLRFPIPQLFACASVVFLFDDSFTIYGGNIASTMAGEFSFSIALSLSFFFFGVFVNGLRTGRRRAWAASLAALAGLSHGIVLFFVIVGAGFLFLFYADRKRWKYFWPVAVVGFLLAAFWLLPFQLRHGFGTDMFYERRPVGNAPNGNNIPDSYWQMFFPQRLWIDWAIMLTAMIGLGGAVVRRWRPGIFLGTVTIFYWVWAWVWPQNLLWNARLLPFMYLTRYMLVALGIAEIGRAVARLIRPFDHDVRRAVGVGAAAVGLVGTLLVVGFHLQRLPFGTTKVAKVKGQDVTVYQWGPFRVKQAERGFVDSWAKWNYEGYERKQAYGEYSAIVSTMKDLGRTNGCGRALWENNNDIDKYGTPMALMLLPFWTDGCIGSMEGLYFEASGTTPYHFLTASAASKKSSNPVRRLSYEDGQLDKAVTYMQTLGVRYYMAYQPEMVAKAANEPRLKEVAESYPWHVYEVADSPLVVGLKTEPLVVSGEDTANRDRWLEIGTSWFQHQDEWVAMPTADGPPAWQRVTLGQVGETKTTNSSLARVAPLDEPEKRELPAVAVSNTKTGDDFVSFDVDKVGVPVLVKTSYFPNWKVSGAEGPYRVAPNLMVVVPTSTSVRLHYGYTGLDLFSYALTALGLIGLVVLWRLGPVSYASTGSTVVDDAEGTDGDGEGTDGPGFDRPGGPDTDLLGPAFGPAGVAPVDDGPGGPPAWTGPVGLFPIDAPSAGDAPAPAPAAPVAPAGPAALAEPVAEADPTVWSGGGIDTAGGAVASTPPSQGWDPERPTFGAPLPPPRPEPEP